MQMVETADDAIFVKSSGRRWAERIAALGVVVFLNAMTAADANEPYRLTTFVALMRGLVGAWIDVVRAGALGSGIVMLSLFTIPELLAVYFNAKTGSTAALVIAALMWWMAGYWCTIAIWI